MKPNIAETKQPRTVQDCITILSVHNLWRRGIGKYAEAGAEAPCSPNALGSVIDATVDYLRNLASSGNDYIKNDKIKSGLEKIVSMSVGMGAPRSVVAVAARKLLKDIEEDGWKPIDAAAKEIVWGDEYSSYGRPVIGVDKHGNRREIVWTYCRRLTWVWLDRAGVVFHPEYYMPMPEAPKTGGAK